MEINGIAHIQITAGRYAVARVLRKLLPFLGLRQVMDNTAVLLRRRRTGVLISPPAPEHEGERSSSAASACTMSASARDRGKTSTRPIAS